MKKTLRWSILVTLLLVCMIVPVMAQRTEAVDYALWIGDSQVTDVNPSGVGWEYIPDQKTLTLDHPTIHGLHEGAIIYSNLPELKVQGTAELKLEDAEYGIWVVDGDLTITGDSTVLTAEAGYTGIYVDNGNITIENGEVTAKGFAGMQAEAEISPSRAAR